MAYSMYETIAGVPALDDVLQFLDSEEAEKQGLECDDAYFVTLYAAWGQLHPGYAGEELDKAHLITEDMGRTTFYNKHNDPSPAEMEMATKAYKALPVMLQAFYEKENITPGVYTIWFTS